MKTLIGDIPDVPTNPVSKESVYLAHVVAELREIGRKLDAILAREATGRPQPTKPAPPRKAKPKPKPKGGSPKRPVPPKPEKKEPDF